MKGDPKATTREEYLASLTPERRADIDRMDVLIRELAPHLAPGFAPGFLGYGPYRYKYESGREGDSFRIAMASQVQYISLYVSCGLEADYLDRKYGPRLPKANIGKCCVRFKRLSDLDEVALRELIEEAAEAVG